MRQDRDDVVLKLDRIASEREVIDQLAAATVQLRAIQPAKREFAEFDVADLGRTVVPRHADLGVRA